MASRVESAIANYEITKFNLQNESVPSWIDVQTDDLNINNTNNMATENDSNEADIVGLLVSVMTTMPRTLFREQQQLVMRRGNSGVCDTVSNAQIASIEQICFNAACISSDVLIKYFCQDGSIRSRIFLQDQHAYDLIDEVISICENVQFRGGWSLVGPIVKVLNAFSQGSKKNELSMDHEFAGGECHNHEAHLFLDMPAKETLRFAQMFIQQFIWEQDDAAARGRHLFRDEASSHIGLFIGHLLEHFSHMASIEAGDDADENSQFGLFEAWSDSTDEHMVQRLNDNDARNIPNLIAQYHVESIESAPDLIESAGSLINSSILESENDEEINENGLNGLIIAVQNTIRHVDVVVTITEVIDKLGLGHAHDINVIFQPMIVSYARFVASYLHDALLLMRKLCPGQEDEEISNLADDLLFRICHTSVGIEFLKKDGENKEQHEVITISLLRAMNSQYMPRKARFLLEVAMVHAQAPAKEYASHNHGPLLKRQRLSSHAIGSSRNSLLPSHNSREGLLLNDTREKMTDVLLACLALSHYNQGEEVNESNHDQVSCITSSLLIGPSNHNESSDANDLTVLDPLNPWHTLHSKPLKKLTTDFELPRNEGDGQLVKKSLLMYTSVVPCFFDTTASNNTL